MCVCVCVWVCARQIVSFLHYRGFPNFYPTASHVISHQCVCVLVFVCVRGCMDRVTLYIDNSY